MIAEALYQTIKSLAGNIFFRGFAKLLCLTPLGGILLVLILANVGRQQRRLGSARAMEFIVGAFGQRMIVWGAVWVRHLIPLQSVVEVLWLFRGFASRPEVSARAFSSDSFQALLLRYPENASLHLAAAVANYTAGNLSKSAASFSIAHDLDPGILSIPILGLNAAFANGHLLDVERAKAHFGRFYEMVDAEKPLDDKETKDQLHMRIMERCSGPLAVRVILDLARKDWSRRYGVFFHSSTQALGHAILDPYYFLALRRQEYDQVFLLGPSRATYRPGSAACLRIIDEYAQYIPVTDDPILNASWMHFGTLSEGSINLCFENYWSLLREAVHRTRDPDDSFRHNEWSMMLPAGLERRGQEFARRIKVDVDQPLVVLHARHDAYHRLGAQAFRNTQIRNYVPAIRHLLNQGYQVVRIGDGQMPRLKIRNKRYVELPFERRYRPEYDPFFIAHADFMIGCQSGPCAYARALGKPLLSVNAVLHYTLLPAPMEMACFKRYEQRRAGRWVPIALEDALSNNAQHFDNAFHFRSAGIRVKEARPGEVLAAVEDMIEWVREPEKAMTPEQVSFRESVEAKCVELKERGAELDKPIADYLGIALPGYRLSPTVGRMRKAAENKLEKKVPATKAV